MDSLAIKVVCFAILLYWYIFQMAEDVKAESLDVSYLTQIQAQELDQELFTTGGFSVDTLMELAGLSVAQALVEEYPSAQNFLVVCGPGNNGGDGFVAARHLRHFGLQPTIVYPKRNKKELFQRLVTQVQQLNIPVLENLPDDFSDVDVIVDALFGFSFKPPLRSPFDIIIPKLRGCGKPVFAIDIPSGWDVENGPISEDCVEATSLISLTAPKLGVKNFTGSHYLGGRFVPNFIREKYKLVLPEYPGTSQIAKL